MYVARILGAAAIAVSFWSSGAPARAQSAPTSHFGRTAAVSTVAPREGRRAAGFERATADGRATDDPLAPYTSRPRVRQYSSATPAPTPPPPPPPRRVVRDYYPTARVGRYTSPAVHAGGGHCTPSRASVFGMMGMSR